MRLLALALLTFGGLCLGASSLSLVINTTDSMPKGLYLPKGNPLEIGDIVRVTPKASKVLDQAKEQGWITQGLFSPYAPLIKRIVALPGDVVSLTKQGLSVNDRSVPKSRPLETLLMPYPFQTLVIPPGQAWVLGDHPLSLDSRYFGPVELRNLQPLKRWGEWE